MNIVQQVKSGVWDAETTLEMQAKMIAMMTYIQFGKFNVSTMPLRNACFWPESRGEIPREIIPICAEYHRALEDSTTNEVKCEFLNYVYENVRSYGNYFYDTKDEHHAKQILGVGPAGIVICHSMEHIVEQ